MKLAQWKMKSKVGDLFLVASETGLRSVYWDAQEIPMAQSLAEKSPEIQILARAAKQLEEYFDGKRKSFDLPLEAVGTEFQKKVWSQLSQIPYGETISYSDVAKRIKNDKAVRAVGTANGRNPLSIIVPCHRVIAADGTLGGYGGGLPNKTILLDLEKRTK